MLSAMAVRDSLRWPGTLPADRRRHHRRTPTERLAYVVIVAISVAIAWALASVT
jgi:hypothetical protein